MDTNISKTNITDVNNNNKNSSKKSKDSNNDCSQSCIKMYDYMIF